MKLGECSVKGKSRTVNRVINGRRVVLHLPKRGEFTLEEVENYMEISGLREIRMVPPGAISPRKLAKKFAECKGNKWDVVSRLSVQSISTCYSHIFLDGSFSKWPRD